MIDMVKSNILLMPLLKKLKPLAELKQIWDLLSLSTHSRRVSKIWKLLVMQKKFQILTQIIEKKLSTQILQKWVAKDFELRESNGSNILDGKTRFDHLFKFLKEQRRQTERVMSVKPPSIDT